MSAAKLALIQGEQKLYYEEMQAELAAAGIDEEALDRELDTMLAAAQADYEEIKHVRAAVDNGTMTPHERDVFLQGYREREAARDEQLRRRDEALAVIQEIKTRYGWSESTA
ncbi:hypothetical protein [Kitasatospora sp. NPDC094016]|uniref:hypothetical protein n=1 Tax=Kitasatospora sp. NPDC094016 TaxID=3154986 RepID=UPI0033266A03